jgi:hypothetical protein
MFVMQAKVASLISLVSKCRTLTAVHWNLTDYDRSLSLQIQVPTWCPQIIPPLRSLYYQGYNWNKTGQLRRGVDDKSCLNASSMHER